MEQKKTTVVNAATPAKAPVDSSSSVNMGTSWIHQGRQQGRRGDRHQIHQAIRQSSKEDEQNWSDSSLMWDQPR